MRLALAIACLASAATAQSPRPFLDGALEPMQALGCIAADALAATQTAAELARASETCLEEGSYDNAVVTFIAMQVFGVFDAQRVLDTSAHQAVAVMGQNIAQSMDASQQAAFQEAVARFGGEGAAPHGARCAKFRDIGPPQYVPRYMTQYGQEAFLFPDDDPLDPAFEPEPVWAAVLANFLKCA